MKTAYWLSAAVGIVALGFTATETPAASLDGVGSLKAVVGENSNVQDVHWRHRRFHRHRHHYHGGYPYYYGRDYYYGGYPYYYRRHHHGPRFGVWGPGFGFYVGPRRRYWW